MFILRNCGFPSTQSFQQPSFPNAVRVIPTNSDSHVRYFIQNQTCPFRNRWAPSVPLSTTLGRSHASSVSFAFLHHVLYSYTPYSLLGNPLRSNALFLASHESSWVTRNRPLAGHVLKDEEKHRGECSLSLARHPNCSTFVRLSRIIERLPTRVFHSCPLPSTVFHESAASCTSSRGILSTKSTW